MRLEKFATSRLVVSIVCIQAEIEDMAFHTLVTCHLMLNRYFELVASNLCSLFFCHVTLKFLRTNRTSLYVSLMGLVYSNDNTNNDFKMVRSCCRNSKVPCLHHSVLSNQHRGAAQTTDMDVQHTSYSSTHQYRGDVSFRVIWY